MESLFLLIPLSLILLGVTVWLLFAALRTGQFEDLDRPGWQVLFDDRDPPPARPQDSEPKEKP